VVAFDQWLVPSDLAQYYYAIPIVVSSLLVSSRGVFATSAAATVACLLMVRLHGIAWLDGQRVVMPLLLMYATAIAAWLGSRQMYSTLGWLQSSYSGARELLDTPGSRA
jgi:hypothetical protein